MTRPESELLLRSMRELDAAMNQATPSAIEVRQFRDLFQELDQLLKSGAQLPTSWITQEGRHQLEGFETHTITDFDPPHRLAMAWCGHPAVRSSEYCLTRTCGNYLHAHQATNQNLAKG